MITAMGFSLILFPFELHKPIGIGDSLDGDG